MSKFKVARYTKNKEGWIKPNIETPILYGCDLDGSPYTSFQEADDRAKKLNADFGERFYYLVIEEAG